jgi:site-specific DNA-methyltransferase (adenine-specific)
MKHELINADSLNWLRKTSRKWDVIFADPPDNIGLGYDAYDDNLDTGEYVEWLSSCVREFTRHAPVVWVSFNARWTADMGHIFWGIKRDYPELVCKSAVQVFTFGQHSNYDLGNNHRPLWRISHKGHQFYPEAIRVPSWRQRNGDKRAAKEGRVPGDVFDMQYPEVYARIGSWLSAALDDPAVCNEMKRDIEIFFQTNAGDVFDFPRVTGNSKQRCDWHPTQLHEGLVERCLKLSVKGKASVLDPFAGTATSLRVCKKLGYKCTLIELDKFYCNKIAKEHKLKVK